MNSEQKLITELRGKPVRTLGERIAAGRQIKGWSQADLARKVSVSRATVSDWESGKIKNIRLEKLYELSDKLELSTRWLAIKSGPPQRRALNTDDEYELIRLFRTLSKEAKRDILGAARTRQREELGRTAEQPFNDVMVTQ